MSDRESAVTARESDPLAAHHFGSRQRLRDAIFSVVERCEEAGV
jgi:hypothetical protein